ncbi:hypothetical protein niasHS_013931 [Heterodera schachtii]|uniref:ISXO2-like transposase domain-containing protein n=1 Tax=Heterodera schachtii TaxID=97005 RepID=A0ABD2IHL9_HETSC
MNSTHGSKMWDFCIHVERVCVAVETHRLRLSSVVVMELGGRFVEIDETLVVKRKYGVGRVLVKQEIWLFGGLERDSNWERVFMVPVESRGANRLLPLIQQYILPGTTIVSDEWRPYRGIPNLPQNYTHMTVNHSRNFVNPANPLAHTQNVESLWKKLKRNFKQHFGNTSETFNTYFPEFVWRQRFGEQKEEQIDTNWPISKGKKAARSESDFENEENQVKLMIVNQFIKKREEFQMESDYKKENRNKKECEIAKELGTYRDKIYQWKREIEEKGQQKKEKKWF